MRKTFWIAAACSIALAGCGAGNSASGGDDDGKTKSSKSASKDSEEEVDSGDEASESDSKPAKSAKSGAKIGKWAIDSHECTATQMSGGNGIKIQQTSSALNIHFVTDWVSEINGPVEVSGTEMEASSVPENGYDWIMVTQPNEDFGGLHDIIENSTSIKLRYGDNQQSFSLADSNRVMDKLLKCAGL